MHTRASSRARRSRVRPWAFSATPTICGRPAISAFRRSAYEFQDGQSSWQGFRRSYTGKSSRPATEPGVRPDFFGRPAGTANGIMLIALKDAEALERIRKTG